MPKLWNNERNPPPADYTTRIIETSWRRILAIAQNQMHEFHDDLSPIRPTQQGQQQLSQEFYDRERHMVHALDTLFQLAYEGPGYLAFISTITSSLDPESPVAMAFLSHIVDRAALPSRETMTTVSPMILSKLNKTPTRRFFCRSSSPRPSSSSLSSTAMSTATSAAVDTAETTVMSIPAIQIPIIIDWKRPCRNCYRSNKCGSSSNKRSNSSQGPSTLLRLNAASIWSLLAEKFAGDLCRELWHSQVGDLLIHLIADTNEDLRVRTFALIALEKFAQTGPIKDIIMRHPCNIRAILQAVIGECEAANQRIYLKAPYYDSPLSPSIDMDIDSIKSSSSPNRHDLISGGSSKGSIYTLWKDYKDQFWTRIFCRKQKGYEDEKMAGYNNDPIKRRASPVEFTSLNSFDTGFLPPEGRLRDEWTKYVQLAHCARWALDCVFVDSSIQTEPACSWDLSYLKVIMNMFDGTAHWKIGGNGLELRNDRPHFESIRATASVKRGKWYYETLLLTNGIMQIGWATSRCRFTPEDGYGVGDDCNGFAFDTYRTAVWADGAAVYPQTQNKIQCRAGDVLGSFLDLDNGLCTFFINGCDLGLTVEFDHPSTHQKGLGGARNIGLGLFPAISLTTHQHVLLNFGDRPWMYPPPVSVKYKGVSQAGNLDEVYKNRVLSHVRKCTVTKPNLAEEGEYDWDGPLCTICFSEPKDIVLLPCHHTGWGQRCANALDMCPLCRVAIQDRIRASTPMESPSISN